MSAPRLAIAFQTDKPLAGYGPLAAAAEGFGFDVVSVYNDLFYQPAWPALQAMAAATERVQLGPAAVNPFTSHPINIAGHVALLDEASNGRAYVGLARGAWLDALGFAPTRPVAALREAFDCLRYLLDGRTDGLAGVHYPIAPGPAFRWPRPTRRIPFLLGAWGPRTIAACGAVVDEIKLGGTANPAVVGWLKEQLEARLFRQAAIVVGAVCVVDDDAAAARALARREVALYLPVVAALDPTTRVAPARLAAIKQAAAQYDYERAAAQIPDELLMRFAFAGDPASVVDQALALFDAGAARVEFGTPHGLTAERGLHVLGTAVLPRLRAALGRLET